MEIKRKVFIGGNWKCNGDKQFVDSHCNFLNGIEFDSTKCEVAICPVFLHLMTAKSVLNPKYILSAQNVSMFDNGAYTGEISSKQLKDIGINWTLIGHSERRQYFHETEQVIGEKLKQALSNGLRVILCIGEKLEERVANQTFQVLETQMKTAVEKVGTNWDKIVIAYEPVWAIGTGKTASPEQAEEAHKFLREYLEKNVNVAVAEKVRIIYGGSANEKNASSLIEKSNIDGFLVGGASLKDAFKIIIESYQKKKF